MKPTRTRRTYPAQPFVLTVLLLSVIAIASFARQHFSRTQDGSGESASSLQRRAVGTLGHGDDEMICRDVHRVADQCAFIQSHCPDEEAGLISYLNLYYCRLGHVKPIAFIIIMLWTGVLFTTIGVAASEFFCINLSTISNILGLSESMAGVTFLAFGNGSPDVFSTFAAIKTHSGSLAIGELFGAAGFITAVVAGSMAMIKDFNVPKRSFMRDVGFFIVAVGFSMTFLSNGSLDLWECAVMVGFYVFYVITVVVWHWRMGRLRKRRELEALARGHFVDPGNEVDFEEEYHDEEDEARPPARSDSRQVSVADFNDLERADFPLLDVTDDEVERDRLMGELSSNMRIRRRTRGQSRSAVFNPIRPSLVGALEFQAAMSSLRKAQNINTPPINLRSYSDGQAITQADQQDAASTTSEPQASSRPRLNTTSSGSARASSDERTDISGGSRARAVSVNAADLLQRVSNRGRHQDAHRHRVLIPEDRPFASSPERHDDVEPIRRTRSPSPLVSISPPTSPPIRVEDTTLNRSGTDGSDLLVPPDPRQPSSQNIAGSQQTETSSHPKRPQLTVTPPESHQASSRPSPRHSPLTPRSTTSSSNFPQLPLLNLPPPSASIEADEWRQEDSKPWRFWPYTVLPPPDELSQALFPSLCGWREKRFWERFLSLATVPSFFFLTITLPVVEPEEDEEEDLPTQRNSIAGLSEERARKTSAPTHNASVPSAPSARPPSPGYRDSTATVAVDAEWRHDHNLQNGGVSPSISGIPQAKDHPQATISAGKEWNRWLIIIQCFTAPFFIVLTVWANFEETSMRTLLLPALYSLLSSMVALLLILVTTTPNRPPRWHFLLCFLGFAVAITWISSIANEVVGVLKTIGVIFNMSDAILGLTIFAVGNSLGDLVADVQVARLGFPYMAFSACFGGPMLNILLGIGLSGLYMTVNHSDKWRHKHPEREGQFKPYKIEISLTLMISAVALLVTLVGLLVAVPANGWRMDRKIGIGLMVLWVATTTANVIVELVGISGEVK